MKQHIKQILLLLISSGTIFGNASHDCERLCVVNPLYCGGFNLQFYAGVSPVVWASPRMHEFFPIN